MSNIKILFLSFLFSALVYPGITLAQEAVTPVLVANVNISSAKIVEQSGSNFSISFTLSNGKGIQNNVKYGVRLVKNDNGLKIVDEKIYDETLTLGSNAQISKNILYSAPNALSGTYTLFVTSSNTSGLPFGSKSLGEVKITSSNKTLEIIGNTCLVTAGAIKAQPISKLGAIYIGDTVTTTCTIVNHTKNTLLVQPLFEVREGTSYGTLSKNIELQYNEKKSLKPLERKQISIILPKVTSTGVYVTSFKLEAGGSYSNTISVPFRTNEVSTSILNVSPDADYYSRKSEANISALWSGAGVSSADVKISTTWGFVCGEASLQNISENQASFVVPIRRACSNPVIALTLKDSTGTILDEAVTEIKTVSRSTNSLFSGIKGTIILISLIIIAGVGIYLRRRKSGNTNPPVAPVIAIIVFLSLVPFSKAHATLYTIPLGSNGNIYANVTLSHEASSPNQLPGQYTPGENIVIDVEINSGSTVTNTISLSAITVGTASVNFFTSPQTLLAAPSAPLLGIRQTLVAPSCGSTLCSYDVEFTMSVSSSSPPPVIGTVFSIGPHMHGSTYYRKVVYVGQAQHPELTVRVKNYGQLVDPYINTTNPTPPSNLDQIYIIPATTSSAPTIQYASCASNCGIPTSGFNYSVVSSVTGAGVTVGTYIPSGYHVCKYPDAPGPGMYFSSAYWGGSFVDDTCQNRYPDAEVVW